MNKLATLLLSLLLLSCTPSLPTDVQQMTVEAPVVPAQDKATIPPNIAPLNFYIDVEADDYIAHIYNKHQHELILKGPDIDIPIDNWQQLLTDTRGDTLYTDIYILQHGAWMHYPTLRNFVAEEDIDPYITYRLIEPSYVTYEGITINQRNITNFDEEVIFSNSALADEDAGQCVNCHNYRNHNRTGDMQLHVREKLGGTLIVRNGQVEKVNLKTDSTLSAGVYPAWHPTLNLIAYSVNSTGQVFHTRDTQKVEVIELGSDLILYDIDHHRVYDIGSLPDEYESFPCWSPDGRYLYYTSAHYEQKSDDIDAELDSAYQSLKYNICRRAFDAKTLRFGPADTVFNARVLGKSASLPRVSPDGRYLLFGLADYGNFHIWHRSSDLKVIKTNYSPSQEMGEDHEAKDGETCSMDAANSPAVDSYHTWSSNGRWLIFSSRRDDNNYTRPYITYFDRQGHAHPAFILPQRNPHFYHQFFKSFNVPEFMVAPVSVSRTTLLEAVQRDAIPAVFSGNAAPATP